MSSDAAIGLIRHYFISRRYSVRCPTDTIALSRTAAGNQAKKLMGCLKKCNF